MPRVRVDGVRVSRTADGEDLPHLVLDEEDEPHRRLAITIGPYEATAIAFALQAVPVVRPMTHDLMADLLRTSGVRVERVVVTDLRERTFYAEIETEPGGRVSSRPSDAVALAVRLGVPVYVEERVLERAGLRPGPEGPG